MTEILPPLTLIERRARRERIAIAITPMLNARSLDPTVAREIAMAAILITDALIAELDKGAPQ